MVSVVVTTYNRKELLKETLDSILSQSYTDFELIVVDNYSNYEFFDHIRSFNDDRIRAYQNENNGIIAANRNFGIKKSRGEYIAFCDDDDLWQKEKLQVQIPLFNDSSVTGVGSSVTINNEGFGRSIPRVQDSFSIGFEKLLNFSNVALSSLVVKNTGLLFDEDVTHMTVEDFYFQLKLTENGKRIQVINKPLVKYRVHAGGESKDVKYIENCLVVLYKFKDKVKKSYFKHLLSNAYLYMGYKCVRNNHTGATKYAIRSILLDLLNVKSYLLLILSIIPAIIRNRIIRIYYHYK